MDIIIKDSLELWLNRSQDWLTFRKVTEFSWIVEILGLRMQITIINQGYLTITSPILRLPKNFNINYKALLLDELMELNHNYAGIKFTKDNNLIYITSEVETGDIDPEKFFSSIVSFHRKNTTLVNNHLAKIKSRYDIV